MVKCSGTYPCRCEIACKCVYNNNTVIVYRFIYTHGFRRAHTHMTYIYAYTGTNKVPVSSHNDPGAEGLLSPVMASMNLMKCGPICLTEKIQRMTNYPISLIVFVHFQGPGLGPIFFCNYWPWPYHKVTANRGNHPKSRWFPVICTNDIKVFMILSIPR